jgi:hypothetical protein
MINAPRRRSFEPAAFLTICSGALIGGQTQRQQRSLVTGRHRREQTNNRFPGHGADLGMRD